MIFINFDSNPNPLMGKIYLSSSSNSNKLCQWLNLKDYVRPENGEYNLKEIAKACRSAQEVICNISPFLIGFFNELNDLNKGIRKYVIYNEKVDGNGEQSKVFSTLFQDPATKPDCVGYLGTRPNIEKSEGVEFEPIITT